MKLQRTCDVVPDGTGLVCRQSRVAGVLMLVVYGGVFAAGPVLAWWFGATWVAWSLGAVVAFVWLLMLGDVRARFRATNWLLWVRPDGLAIHFRSYQDASQTDGLAVVELGYDEIAHAARHVERYTTPGTKTGSTRSHKLESLDVRLRQADASELAAAVAENRKRRQPERVHLGFIRSRTKLTHFSVTVPADGLIRIAWRGGRHHVVSPALRRVLAALSGRISIAEPTDAETGDWQNLSDDRLDALILELVISGDRITAVKLLVRRRGYSLTEAHKFVDELGRRA